MTGRRQFLAGLAAASVLPAPGWADVGAPRYLAAGVDAAGSYVLAGLDAGGGIRFRLPLPDRGHAAAAHPTRPEAVAFARRPGTFALVLDCRDGRRLAQLSAPPGRHFYGHGCFAHRGDVLVTTENDFDAGRGVLGLWDARRGYARIGEIPSNGIGPHEIRHLPDGTLAVANGGIDTHPDTGRTKLNLPDMRPNLSLLDLDGKLRAAVAPPHHHASVRHIAVRADGAVGIGMQWQGSHADVPPLLALYSPGAPLRLLGDAAGLQGYVGSVAFTGDGQALAATSPRGNRLRVVALSGAGTVQDFDARDICGVAPAEAGGLLATTGMGETLRLPGASTGTPQLRHMASADLRWDNHLVAIGAG